MNKVHKKKTKRGVFKGFFFFFFASKYSASKKNNKIRNCQVFSQIKCGKEKLRFVIPTCFWKKKKKEAEKQQKLKLTAFLKQKVVKESFVLLSQLVFEF